ncbi:hypothetical protein GCWU000325_01993 [Alloprevotella tannerae ATCC 51259]|uniref:Uncharacterized protein n=1 Tax=Alloprevotella tannerae ATCC 51259 TaxID=626522 RepID=C9LID4_9BACT|nr:hypothetical protein GCWU000325_01993 [Alloprevotella tannerae ATCC 51259]
MNYSKISSLNICLCGKYLVILQPLMFRQLVKEIIKESQQ